jgi:hypothetical protein
MELKYWADDISADVKKHGRCNTMRIENIMTGFVLVDISN